MASQKCCPSLLAGLLWTGLGVLFLLQNHGIGPDIWRLLGRYWPILLILLGLGKVIDYYRQKEGVSIRVGEIFGIFFILIIGSAISRVTDSAVGDLIWRAPIRIGSSEVSLGNSYSYTQEASYPVSPDTPLAIENSYGSVTVAPGSDGEVRVRLKKVVYSDEEARAKDIAGQISIEGRPQGSAEATAFTLKTNREDLAAKEYRFNTDMEVFVPKRVRLRINNSYGEVSVSSLEGQLDVSSSQKPVEIRDFKGDVTASNRYGESRLSDITGKVTVEARGRVEVESVNGEVNVRNEYSPILVKNVDGPVTLHNTESSITVESILKPVTIDARGSQVTARNLTDSLKVTTSHGRIQIYEAGAGVTINSQYATVTLAGAKGDVVVESNSDRLNLENIGGKLKVKGKGSSVRATQITGAVDIESSLKDVVVNNFEDGCVVANEYADITLSTFTLSKNGITARNRNGDIDLFLPRQATFQLDAAAKQGQIASDFEGFTVEAGPGDLRRIRGSLKSGGPAVSLQTEYGKIRLRVYERERERERKD